MQHGVSGNTAPSIPLPCEVRALLMPNHRRHTSYPNHHPIVPARLTRATIAHPFHAPPSPDREAPNLHRVTKRLATTQTGHKLSSSTAPAAVLAPPTGDRREVFFANSPFASLQVGYTAEPTRELGVVACSRRQPRGMLKAAVLGGDVAMNGGVLQ